MAGVVEDFADDVLDDGNELENFNEIRYSFIKNEGDLSYGTSIDEGIGIYENERGRQGADSIKTQHGWKDLQVSQVAQEGSVGESSDTKTRRNSWDGSRNRQNLKFSLKANANYTLSNGQVKKKVADYTMPKVYAKKGYVQRNIEWLFEVYENGLW